MSENRTFDASKSLDIEAADVRPKKLTPVFVKRLPPIEESEEKKNSTENPTESHMEEAVPLRKLTPAFGKKATSPPSKPQEIPEKTGNSTSTNVPPSVDVVTLRTLNYEELEYSPSQCIGQGNSATVYKVFQSSIIIIMNLQVEKTSLISIFRFYFCFES